ncbi:hypothetical protein Tco_1323109 [Tanacetum coccineum]
MNPNNVQGPPPAGPPPQNHNGPPGPNLHMPAPDLRTMEELCQPTMNGRGGPIALVNIQAIDFGLKNHMIQQASIQSMQNEMADLKKILLQRPQGALPSNTEPNPSKQVNSIMTRSGLTTAEPYKEKLEELANTPVNVECSAILLNKVPEKLEDPRKFLIPCILQDLEVCNSLADSGASINLMPLSIYE